MEKPNVLIVDDEPFNVDYLEQELEDYDCEIRSAGSGQQALDLMQTGSTDLVLLDIMMPGMDGFEVLKRMRADPTTRDIPVIVISAANNIDSVVKGIALGAEDYLPKPFEPNILKARVTSSLEKKRLRDIERMYLRALQNEMQIAREIQSGFLPSALPSHPGWEIAVHFKAAKEVAGDFYDTFLLPDNSLVFVVGDVCGKGVGAALFMTLFRSLIRVTCTTDTISGISTVVPQNPAQRLEHAVAYTNQYIAEVHGDANMFATLFIGILDSVEDRMTYINCGNEPPLLLHRSTGEISKLMPTGPVIGVIPDARYACQEITMEINDILAAFTDGIPDAVNAGNVPFGTDHIMEMYGVSAEASAEVCRRIQENLEAHIGTADQFDDITLLVVKRTDDR